MKFQLYVGSGQVDPLQTKLLRPPFYKSSQALSAIFGHGPLKIGSVCTECSASANNQNS